LFFLVMPAQLIAQSSIIIRHINIVDVKTGTIQPNRIVYIKGNKIDAIEKDNDKNRRSFKGEIEGTNKYLIPGLWDMHTHDVGWLIGNAADSFITPIMLANGITGMRDMWGSKDAIALRDSVNRNLMIAPRMLVGSPIVNGPRVFSQAAVTITNIKEVPGIVDSLQREGYDFIKVYSFLRHDLFFALAKYCKEKRIPFEGHVPIGVSAENASSAGMRSLEHLFGLRKSFSITGEKLIPQWEAKMLDTSVSQFEVLLESESSAHPFDTTIAKKVTATIVANGTFVVPTLVACKGYTFDRDSLMQSASMQYVPKALKQYWYEARAMLSFEKDMLQNFSQMLTFVHEQKLNIMAGTDTGNPFVIPGFSLHDELELYVRAGLTPLEALQTATLNPAIFLHLEKELGTVTKGKLADLVILDQNPLRNIKNTRRIHAIIMNGHLIDKDQIHQFLQKLKERASE
jgi:Amidohydrolase family